MHRSRVITQLVEETLSFMTLFVKKFLPQPAQCKVLCELLGLYFVTVFMFSPPTPSGPGSDFK